MSGKFLQIAVLTACVGALGLAAGLVEAKRPEAKLEVVPAGTPETFAVQAKHVRAAMRGDGRYSMISTSDRNQVEADIVKIKRLLDNRGSVANLTDREHVTVSNAQEEANALLTDNDGDRLICRYEKRTGSHFREKYCNTVSELAKRRNEDQEAFRHMNRPPVQQGTPCPTPGGLGCGAGGN